MNFKNVERDVDAMDIMQYLRTYTMPSRNIEYRHRSENNVRDRNIIVQSPGQHVDFDKNLSAFIIVYEYLMMCILLLE